MLCDIAKIGQLYKKELLKKIPNLPSKYFIMVSPLKEQHRKEVLHIELDLYAETIHDVYVADITFDEHEMMLKIPKIYVNSQKRFPSLFIATSGDVIDYINKTIKAIAKYLHIPVSDEFIAQLANKIKEANEQVQKQKKKNQKENKIMIPVLLRLYDRQKDRYVFPGELTGFWDFWEQQIEEILSIKKTTNNVFSCVHTDKPITAVELSRALKFATYDKKGFVLNFDENKAKHVDVETFLYIFKGWEILRNATKNDTHLQNLVIIPSMSADSIAEIINAVRWAMDPNIKTLSFLVRNHPELKYTILFVNENKSEVKVKTLWYDVFPSRLNNVQQVFEKVTGKPARLQVILNELKALSDDIRIYQNFGVGKQTLYLLFLTKLFIGQQLWTDYAMRKTYTTLYREDIDTSRKKQRQKNKKEHKQSIRSMLSLLQYINQI